MQFALNKGAVQWCRVTAHLYEQQIRFPSRVCVHAQYRNIPELICIVALSGGVAFGQCCSALTQPCCEPDLHSTTGQWGLPLASVAVHWRWVTAHLYEEQIFIGVVGSGTTLL